MSGPRPGGCILSVLALLALGALCWIYPALLLVFSFNDNGDPQGVAYANNVAAVGYWGTRALMALAVLGMVCAFWPRKVQQDKQTPPQSEQQGKQTPPGEDS